MIPATYWSPTKKLMVLGAMAGGKLVEDTATGNPLTFITDKAKPLKSLLIPFIPQQQGTGDPSPDNIRPLLPWDGLTVWQAGKNLLDVSKGGKGSGDWKMTFSEGKVTNSEMGSGASDYVIFSQNIKAGTYTISFDCTSNISPRFLCTAPFQGGNYNSYYKAYYKDGKQITFTITESASVGVVFSAPNHVGETGSIFDIQLEVGQTASAYEPYHPITETNIVFPALGKNLLPDSSVEYGSYGTTGGKIQDDNNKYRRLSINLPAGNYVFSTDTPNCYFIRLLVNDSVVGTGGEVSSKAFTLTEASNVKIAWRNTDTSAITDTLHNQIEAGQSATAYEPYTNAVYGGTLDVVSGVLTVEWVSLTKTWGDFGNKTSLGDNLRGVYSISSFPSLGTGVGAMCNIAPRKLEWSQDSVHFYTNEGSCIVFLPNGTADSTEIQVVYPLATTQEIQLTPTQLTALIGNNTIWSDADGQMTAVYLKKG